jgi:CheY-like chemotaxis protein
MSAKRVILIADDDASDLFFLRQAFEERCPGVEIHEARDGQEAIEYLQGRGEFADRTKHPLPAEIVLDIKMPRRTGLEVLEWVRQRPELRDLSVTVLSGSELAGDMEKARALGARYFVKPVEYAALLDFVSRFNRA